MSIVEKIARIVFFPIFWMNDIREELAVMRYFMARRTFGPLRGDPEDEDAEDEAAPILRASFRRGPKGQEWYKL
ncbi:MAG: hypothetical protein FWH34_05590 [Desulfovibrionaceae bacterium]|nr:hypothetical protein [Desulfovibrionaceae bacterium]